MTDEDDGIDGLIVDDDPVLDCILYEEMVEDEKKPGHSGKGCLGLFLLLLLPIAPGILWKIL